MMAPKRVRIANSVSFTVKSENATKSSSPATTKNQGKRRELISALPPRAGALDRDLVGLILGGARGALGTCFGLALDALLEQLLDGEIHQVAAGARVDDHLVGMRQHVLDGVGVEPAPGDFRCLCISSLELSEARRLPFRDRRDLRL